MNRFFKSALFPILVVVLLAYVAQTFVLGRGSGGSEPRADYSKLALAVQKHEVDYMRIDPPAQRISYTIHGDSKTYSTGYEPQAIAGLIDTAIKNGTQVSAAGKGGFSLWSVIGWVLPILLVFAFWLFLMNQMQGGGSKVMSFGKSRAKRMAVDSPKITFKDVAGADEAVEELHEIKEFLENPKKFQALGARIPKGVLLFGPPGTGKTLLARAVAGEAGVPFFSISGSDFVEMFVGVGASRVRDLFEQAKQNSPCIIFMDEIDAVGRHRGAGLGGGHDEREQTLNQLLVEMDGFELKDNIILIAATNRPDILDPALLRPGRFDRQIVVDRPDRLGRQRILEVHTKGKPIAREIDLGALAGQTPGFTGADLANLVNEAALLAARHGRKTIGMIELEEGIMRVIAGPEKKTRLLSEQEQLITAYHEMGHALVGHYLEGCDPVHKISVISRGQALGYTIAMPTEDTFLTTRKQLRAQLAMTLGGRAAEELVFQEVTTGAANDLEKVTGTAKNMIMRYGMSDKLGPRTLGRVHDQPFLGREFAQEPDYSEEIAREIDDEIRRIVEEAHERARGVLVEHEESLHRISRILVERETIDREQFLRLLAGEPEDAVFVEEPAAPVEAKPEKRRRTEKRTGLLPIPPSLSPKPPDPEASPS
jgi:cell division protease FtsH